MVHGKSLELPFFLKCEIKTKTKSQSTRTKKKTFFSQSFDKTSYRNMEKSNDSSKIIF